MDSLQRACVSLLISADDLLPANVTALLGREPRRGIAKGQTFIASDGKKTEARTGMWDIGGDWQSPPDLDRQIADLLEKLPVDQSIWNRLADRYECYISVGGYLTGWTGGMTLKPETMRLLAERNLTIDFDLYAPDVSD